MNSRRISLRVSGISVSSAVWSRAQSAARTDKKAQASRARMVQRCQEVQLRTWCSSSAASSFPAANPSSIFHRDPATRTSWASGTGCGERAR